jgi:preprotein translocase subunit SecD
MRLKRNIFLITILTAVALIIDAPKNYPLKFPLFGREIAFTISSPTINITSPFVFSRNLEVKQGLDLQGGTEVTLEADMKDVALADRQDALDSAKEVVARRVDL